MTTSTGESHALIIIDSPEKVTETLQSNKDYLAILGNVIVQEVVMHTDAVTKVYASFDQFIIGHTNTLDDDALKKGQVIDGYTELKKKVKKETDKNTMDVVRLITDHLRKKGFVNFGFDLVKQIDTQNYFVFDFNPDGGNWHKHLDSKQKPSEFFQSGILYLLETIKPK